MINTKAYHINEAERELARDKELTRLQVINFITNPMNKEEHGTIAWNDKEQSIEKELNTIGYCQIYLKEAHEAYKKVKLTGAYPYNSTVAKELLKILGLTENDKHIKRAEHIVYGTNRHYRHEKEIEHYHEYIANGYISLQDITEDQDGKQALLSGNWENDMFSGKKENEKIKLVCRNGKLGYQTKGQRNKYHVASTNDLFIKII